MYYICIIYIWFQGKQLPKQNCRFVTQCLQITVYLIPFFSMCVQFREWITYWQQDTLPVEHFWRWRKKTNKKKTWKKLLIQWLFDVTVHINLTEKHAYTQIPQYTVCPAVMLVFVFLILINKEMVNFCT